MCKDRRLVKLHEQYLALSPSSQNILRMRVQMIIDWLRVEEKIDELIKQSPDDCEDDIREIQERQAEFAVEVEEILNRNV